MRNKLIRKWVEITRKAENEYINSEYGNNHAKDEAYETITRDMRKHKVTEAEITEYQDQCTAIGV